jgi:hypothetical protein
LSRSWSYLLMSIYCLTLDALSFLTRSTIIANSFRSSHQTGILPHSMLSPTPLDSHCSFTGASPSRNVSVILSGSTRKQIVYSSSWV